MQRVVFQMTAALLLGTVASACGPIADGKEQEIAGSPIKGL
jgi:hypothetical protein